MWLRLCTHEESNYQRVVTFWEEGSTMQLKRKYNMDKFHFSTVFFMDKKLFYGLASNKFLSFCLVLYHLFCVVPQDDFTIKHVTPMYQYPINLLYYLIMTFTLKVGTPMYQYPLNGTFSIKLRSWNIQIYFITWSWVSPHQPMSNTHVPISL